MKKFTFLAVLIFLGYLGHSQIMFDNSYDFGAMDSDEAFGLEVTPDGGYIMSGASWIDDNAWYDMVVIKTDAEGNKLWGKSYGVGSGNMEIAYDICAVDEGGYIMVGGTDGYGDPNDLWAIRIDEDGEQLWEGTYGDDNQEYGFDVMQTADGGFIFTGSSNSSGAGADDVYIVKTDADGNELWSKLYGTESADCGYSIDQTTDGGYIVAGTNNGYQDLYLLRLDENGDLIWEKTYGEGPTDEAQAVKQTADGGFIVAGSTRSYGAGDYDVWLIKTDANGDMVWNNTYGGTGKDRGWDVSINDDGTYFITGMTESYNQAEDDEGVYVIKTDNEGNTLWEQSYGTEQNDGGHAGFQTADGGYIASGYTYVAGQQYDFYLIKMNQNGIVSTNNINNSNSAISVYPNPFHTTAQIQFPNPENTEFNISLRDINGRKVFEKHHCYGNSFTINKDNLRSGLYFIELISDNIYTKKIIIN